ncbi:hypothetical protein ID866_12179, partial [Astraeus odoratus]
MAWNSVKFVRTFGGIISQSTPHLYISGLALSLLNSPLFKKFSPMYPWLAQAVGGDNAYWPCHEMTLRGHTHCVSSVAFSADGKRIASGSEDNTICLWDAETGLQLGSPLKGH